VSNTEQIDVGAATGVATTTTSAGDDDTDSYPKHPDNAYRREQNYKRPRLSFITPCWSGAAEAFEKRLVRSICEQTVKPDEVVIAISSCANGVCDGSLNRARATLAACGVDKLVVDTAPLKRMPGQNRNAAAAAASMDMDYFVMFDCDDILHYQYIEYFLWYQAHRPSVKLYLTKYIIHKKVIKVNWDDLHPFASFYRTTTIFKDNTLLSAGGPAGSAEAKPNWIAHGNVVWSTTLRHVPHTVDPGKEDGVFCNAIRTELLKNGITDGIHYVRIEAMIYSQGRILKRATDVGAW
jgi:hypothetical protein